ncbi:MAG: sensor histidine kinase [Flavobacterium sp.]|nr:MAG: sensor histidine kinase [Flavobacterium sp.]
MDNLKYKSILYFIAAVILTTFCIQAYWNFKNYEVGKQQLINDVQTSLDNAVEQYYSEIAKEQSFSLISKGMEFSSIGKADSVWYGKDSVLNNLGVGIFTEDIHQRSSVTHAALKDSTEVQIMIVDSAAKGKVLKRTWELNDSTPDLITSLSSKIIVSITEDSLSLKTLDTLFFKELRRKNISLDYGLSYEGIVGLTEQLRPEKIASSKLSTTAQSPYSFHDYALTAHFGNITLTVLKKNLLGLLLSFVLVGAVILCLMYLLRIIRQQKELSELKNDLINNITHEFKTPIATIGVAMEAIQEFNTEQDIEKNLRYAKISQEQVNKLNVMVEKLLDTATLDSEKLQLNKEKINLVEMLEKTTLKEIYETSGKRISFKNEEDSIKYEVDIFHFENALNNIIDNAVKYGGHEITVSIESNRTEVVIEISDSGNDLSEQHKKRVFEKFYRVPKGNTHDIKGFGIGLYYTKKIVEKHGGTIDLYLDKLTTFKISLPYAN